MTGKILVVDDDPHILYLLRVIMKTEGFTVITCQDETQALALIRKENPNLVVLDLLLPKMDGWELCKAIRANPETQKLPVLIMSSLPFKERERRLARELDVFDYVTKPFEPIYLLGRIRSLFQVPQPLRHMVKETPQEAQVRRGAKARKVEALIVGGGIAGIAACEACARSGTDTYLLSLWPFLANELMAYNALAWFVEQHRQEEEKFFQFLKKDHGVRRSERLGAYVVDPEKARRAAYQLLKEYRVPFALNAKLLDVIREGAAVKGVVIEGENGLERIEARSIIDATLEGRVLDLAQIPVPEEDVSPRANFLLGGVDGRKLEEGASEFEIVPLPSLREAVLLDIPLEPDWQIFFYEGINGLVSQAREKVPGCKNAYLLRRPLGLALRRRNMRSESHPLFGMLIPKAFDQILMCGYPFLKQEQRKDALGLLYFYGKMAGTLVGLSLAYNQSFREIEGERVREALKAEGVAIL